MTKRDNGATLQFTLSFIFLGIGIACSILYRNLNVSPGESGSAALSLLNHGYIGNPYLIPTGPTAHVSPTVAYILAVIYGVSDGNTPLAREIQGIVASGLYAAGIYLTLHMTRRASASLQTTMTASALFLVFPMYAFLTPTFYRQWDEPYGAVLLLVGWYAYRQGLQCTAVEHWSRSLALITGVGGLFSPVVLPPLGIALLHLLWVRRRTGRPFIRSVQCFAIVAIVLLPWSIRNEIMLHSFIVTRSNFGLELAIGNEPHATGYSMGLNRLGLHPHDSLAAAELVRKIGEVAYMHRMTGLAVGWIKADPVRFLVLTIKRVWYCFFPARALVGWEPIVGSLVPWVMFNVLGAIKLTSLGVALYRRKNFIQGVVFIVLPYAPYFITHVDVRYSFIDFFASVFFISITLSSSSKHRSLDWRHYDIEDG